jgi:hypothetical protein
MGVMFSFLGEEHRNGCGILGAGEIEGNVCWNLGVGVIFEVGNQNYSFWIRTGSYQTWTYRGMDRWNDAVQPVRLLESDDAKNSNIMVDKNVCIMSALEFLPKLGRA